MADAIRTDDRATAAGRLRSRLPSLWRPDDGDDGPLPAYLEATGGALDRLSAEVVDTLRAHWFELADAAVAEPFVARARELAGLPALGPTDPEVRAFPYVRDLALLAALLGLAPWEDAPPREAVEDLRDRVRRTVAVYRSGVGTRGALRGIVEANLPVDDSVPAQLRDRPFTVEEFAPIARRTLVVTSPGPPDDLVGPLMGWSVDNDGLAAAPPTIFVQGVEAQDSLVGATERPLIELVEAGGRRIRLGIGYAKTLDPGVTARLRPSVSSWLARADGLFQADSFPSDGSVGSTSGGTRADPTAPGPWAPVTDAPAGAVTALLQTQELALWVATLDGAVGALARFDGSSWIPALSGLKEVNALAEDGSDLLVATDAGLLRMARFPDDGITFVGTPVSGLETARVDALLADPAGGWFAGTSEGVVRIAGDGSVHAFGLDPALHTDVAVHALAADVTGTIHVGTDLGAFQHHSGSGAWYWYAGGSLSEQDPDWNQLQPGGDGDDARLPTPADVSLPFVRSIVRAPDASLWLGTDRGIARYVAVEQGGAYATVLQAFPNITLGRVSAIEIDPRGHVWFATDRGVIRSDGRDWFQFQPSAGEAGDWVHLGRIDRPFEPGAEGWGAWRFVRGSGSWEHADLAKGVWSVAAVALETSAEPAVRAVAWTDGVVADLVRGFDGSSFDGSIPPEPVEPGDIRIRYKPTETRIVDGGIPSCPRIPMGGSSWRYLSIEPAAPELPADRPFWTSEGRLIPPPDNEGPAVAARFDRGEPPPSDFDAAAFAYDPAARVWMQWDAATALTALVRLAKRSPDEHLEPAVVDRAWEGIQRVRPAGVWAMLAVGEDIVRR